MSIGTQPFTRRGFIRFTSLGAAAALLAACSGQQPASSTQQVVTKEVPVEVTRVVEKQVIVTATAGPASKAPVKLTISTDWNAGVRKATIDTFASEYKKTNPHVTDITVWHLGAGGMTATDYGGVVQTMLVAGNGPDVMWEIWWRPQELLLHLDPYLQAQKFKKADFWWSKYLQEVENGDIYSLPLGVYVGGFVANLDLFDAAGLKPPTKGWTFNDLWELAAKLKTSKTWGFERQTGDWNQGWTERVASEGTQWYDTNKLKTTLDLPGVERGNPVASFSDWWGAVWKQHLAPTPDEATGLAQANPESGASAGSVFLTGQVALSGFPFNQAGDVNRQIGGRFRYQVLWPPASVYSGRRGYHLETNCISVNKDVKDRGYDEDAFGLAYSWLGDTMEQNLAQNVAVIPPSKKWYHSADLAKAAPGMEIFGDLADEAQQIGNDRHKWLQGTGSSPNWPDWWKAVTNRLLNDALINGKDPVASLKAAIVDGDKALAKKV